MNYLHYFLKQFKISWNFKKKLRHNFHELTWLERIIYFCCIRPFWSSQKRFLFEAHWGLPGQMYLAERETLYNTITEHQPRFCLEIGTYTGGGSTYFLASAFQKIGKGKLFTLESNEHYFNKASRYYARKLPHLTDFASFIHGETLDSFQGILSEHGAVDCVLLDGAEDGQQTLDQYKYLLPYFKPGSIVIMHDWNTYKTELLKPIILQDSHWQLIRELTLPASVGLAVFKYL